MICNDDFIASDHLSWKLCFSDKMKIRPSRKINEAGKSAKDTKPYIIGKARSDFNKLLEERGETNFFSKKDGSTSHARGLFYDFARLVGVLQIPPLSRTESELLLIADELSNTNICQDLGISPAHGLEVAKYATVARFQEKSCIIREGQVCMTIRVLCCPSD